MANDLTGTTLGKYQIIERLGRGGMADVYRAFQPLLERYVAVKVMHTNLTEDEDFITRFKREAQIVGSLRHPNIVQVIDFDIHDGEYFMVMEYVQGDTLKAMLKRRGALQIGEALDIAAKLADALAYAHSKGMIHRDIKPANVLMDKNGSPILSDFGIAHLSDVSGLTSTGMTVGTPSYMSPEAGRGEKVDERTDIYSLGIVLYEMLTGTVPFDADTPYAVIMKHINDPLPMPRQFGASLPAFVEKVVLKALAKNREDRYQVAAEFRSAIDKALEQLQNEPTSSATATNPVATVIGTQIAQPTSSVTPRRISPVAILAIVALLLFLVGGAYLLSRPPAAAPPPTQPSVAIVPTITATTLAVVQPTATEKSTIASTATQTPQTTTATRTEMPVIGTPSASGQDIALATQIRNLLIRGSTGDAMDKVNSLLKVNPQSYDLIVLHGQINIETGQENANQALKDAQAALKLDPARPEAYVLLGQYYQFGFSYDKSEDIVATNKKAIEYYNQAEQKGGSDYYIFWLRARSNSTINDYIGADNNVSTKAIADDLEKAASLNPQDDRFFVFRGNYYASLDETDLALQSYDRALALNANIDVHRQIAEVYIRLGHPENALKYYKGQINDKRETNIDYIAQGAYVAWRSNDLETATEWADLALSLEPKATSATYVKGLIAFDNQMYDEALKFFDQVAQTKPDTYSFPFLNGDFGHHIQYERGLTLVELGKQQEAINAFSMAIKDNPYWVEALVERAKLYRQLGKIDEARADLRAALDLTSSDKNNTRRDEILALLKQLNAPAPEASETP